MAIRWKKAKGRRIAPERGKPIRRARRFADLPPSKSVIRILIVMLSYIATVLILYFGTPPLDIRPGETAEKHYISRVTFSCEDKDLTELRKERKRQEQPNVYVSDEEVVSAMQNAVIATLKGSIPPQAAANGKSVPKIDALREQVKAMGEQQTAEAIGAVFALARSVGVIDEAQRVDEQRLNHRTVIVLNTPENEKRAVRVDETISLQKELPQFLKRQVDRHFAKMPADAKTQLLAILVGNFRSPTLKRNAEETNKAREEAAKTVPPQIRKIQKGSVILARGATATQQDIFLLENESAEYARGEPVGVRIEKLVGSALLVLFGYALMAVYVYRYQEALIRSNNRLFMLVLLCLLVLAVVKVFVYKGWALHAAPVPLVSIISTLAYGQQFGLVISLALSIITAVVAGNSFEFFAIFMIGSATAVLATRKVRNRSRLVHVGILTGLALSAATWAMGLLEGQKLTKLFWNSPVFRDGVWSLANGVLVGIIVTGLLPLLERVFGIVTDISLLEWCDQNQPILRKLVLEAPGTYHHSLLVGNLAEAAAETVGGNALLARAGAYYHDIGKLNKPEYFVENVGEEHSKHSILSPTLSTLIITAHTKDGAELAEAYDLPEAIRDMIVQHHGTTLVEYFYEKAVRQATKDNGETVDESLFRYRGPLPRSREAGIVLLADSVESASRTLSEPTPSRIRQLVREVSSKKLMDSQFVESGLTLTDIRQIEDSLIRGLTAIFHSRIRYR